MRREAKTSRRDPAPRRCAASGSSRGTGSAVKLGEKDVGSLPLPGDRKFGLVVDQLVGEEEFVITALNEQGFHFNIYTPVVRRDALGEKSTEDQES